MLNLEWVRYKSVCLNEPLLNHCYLFDINDIKTSTELF